MNCLQAGLERLELIWTPGHRTMRLCLNELQTDYCVKIKTDSTGPSVSYPDIPLDIKFHSQMFKQILSLWQCRLRNTSTNLWHTFLFLYVWIKNQQNYILVDYHKVKKIYTQLLTYIVAALGKDYWFTIRMGLGFQICNQYHLVCRKMEPTLALKSKWVKWRFKIKYHVWVF